MMQAFCEADSLEIQTPDLDICIEELALEQGHLFVQWYDYQSDRRFITRREETERSSSDDLRALARDPKALTSIISEPSGRFEIESERLKNGLNADVISYVNANLAGVGAGVNFPEL